MQNVNKKNCIYSSQSWNQKYLIYFHFPYWNNPNNNNKKKYCKVNNGNFFFRSFFSFSITLYFAHFIIQMKHFFSIWNADWNFFHIPLDQCLMFFFLFIYIVISFFSYEFFLKYLFVLIYIYLQTKFQMKFIISRDLICQLIFFLYDNNTTITRFEWILVIRNLNNNYSFNYNMIIINEWITHNAYNKPFWIEQQ